MKLWCFDDAHNWGKQLETIATARGHDAVMFTQTGEPTEGHVLVAMHSHPAVKEYHKRIVQHLATVPAITPIPQYRVAMLNDNKIEQLRQLAKWFPITHLIKNPSVARQHIEKVNKFPIISKSSSGGGIRFLNNADDMNREVKLAWSDLGIKNRHGGREHGFVYWQDYMGEHPHVWRIVAVGADRIAIKRAMRKSNSSDREVTAIDKFAADDLLAIDVAQEIFKKEDIKFGAIDIMRSSINGQWYLLKVLVTFQLRTMFDSAFIFSGRKGTQMFHVMMDEIEGGRL